jgi:hypothetical protein
MSPQLAQSLDKTNHRILHGFGFGLPETPSTYNTYNMFNMVVKSQQMMKFPQKVTSQPALSASFSCMFFTVFFMVKSSGWWFHPL